jgi:hypothetical protein
MMEAGRAWLGDVWGACASAVITGVLFSGLPVLHALNPSIVPLAQVVEEVERPVFVDLEALLALQAPPVSPDDPPPSPVEAPPPPEVDDEAEQGTADEVGEEVLASAHEGASGPLTPSHGSDGEASQEAKGEGVAVDPGPYTVQVAKVVAGPRVRFTLADMPEGSSDAQVQAFLGAMKAGSGIQARSRGKRGRCRTSNPDIHPKTDGTFDVNRSLVEHYTSSLKNFNSLGWSGPHNEDGERGWKIGGFGCNSPLHFAGLRRGDIVKTVNGKKTNTWLQVFGAYQRLKHKDDFVIAVVRRGEPLELRYHLI